MSWRHATRRCWSLGVAYLAATCCDQRQPQIKYTPRCASASKCAAVSQWLCKQTLRQQTASGGALLEVRPTKNQQRRGSQNASDVLTLSLYASKKFHFVCASFWLFVCSLRVLWLRHPASFWLVLPLVSAAQKEHELSAKKCARHVNNSTQSRFGRFSERGGTWPNFDGNFVCGCAPDFIMFSFRGVGFLICAHLTADRRGRCAFPILFFCFFFFFVYLQMRVQFFSVSAFVLFVLRGCRSKLMQIKRRDVQ